MTQPAFSQSVARALMDSRTDAIIAADLDGVIQLWNPGAERLFGYPPSDVIGRSLDLIIPERLRARHWHGFEQWIRTGQGRHQPGEILSVPALHRDGHTLKVQFTITPLSGEDGGTRALIAVLHERRSSPTTG